MDLIRLFVILLICNLSVKAQDYNSCYIDTNGFEIELSSKEVEKIVAGNIVRCKIDILSPQISSYTFEGRKEAYVRHATRKGIKKNRVKAQNLYIRNDSIFERRKIITDIGIFLINDNSFKGFDDSNLSFSNIKIPNSLNIINKNTLSLLQESEFQIEKIDKSCIFLVFESRRIVVHKLAFRNYNISSLDDLFIHSKSQIDSTYNTFQEKLNGLFDIVKNRELIISISGKENIDHINSTKIGVVPLDFSIRNGKVFFKVRRLIRYDNINRQSIWKDGFEEIELQSNDDLVFYNFDCFQQKFQENSSNTSNNYRSQINQKYNKNKKNSSSTKAYKTSKTYSVQCSGRTQKGKRCKNMTRNSSGRCHHH